MKAREPIVIHADSRKRPRSIAITYADLQDVPRITITRDDLQHVLGELEPAKTTNFYRKLRRQIKNWAGSKGKGSKYLEYILVAPDLFVLLTRLVADSRVDPHDKALLLGTIAYFVLPLDVLPEVLLGPVGYVDDVMLTVFTLHRVLNHTPREVVLEHWEGDQNLIEMIGAFVSQANDLLGSGVWQRVRQALEPGGEAR